MIVCLVRLLMDDLYSYRGLIEKKVIKRLKID